MSKQNFDRTLQNNTNSSNHKSTRFLLTNENSYSQGKSDTNIDKRANFESLLKIRKSSHSRDRLLNRDSSIKRHNNIMKESSIS